MSSARATGTTTACAQYSTAMTSTNPANRIHAAIDCSNASGMLSLVSPTVRAPTKQAPQKHTGKDVPGGLSPPSVGQDGCRHPERARAMLSTGYSNRDAGFEVPRVPIFSKGPGLQVLSAVSSLGRVMLTCARREHVGCSRHGVRGDGVFAGEATGGFRDRPFPAT